MQNKVQIGIIGAMKVEIDGLRAIMKNSSSVTLSGIEFVSGEISGKKVVTAVCGIGKVFAAICTQTMILSFSPDVIINTGVAGTLSEKLSIGDIAIARNSVQHDMDTTALGDELGLISGPNIVYIPADEKLSGELYECVKSLGINCVLGTVATGDCFINDDSRKKAIAENFSAVACEMEGGAVAQTCYVNSVPFSVLRAISDGGDDNSHLDYPTFVKMAAQRSIEVLKKFIVDYAQ